ncbi:MAG: DbpA RNA binding domain-containing protein [Treponema sp.]|nr:DbpA RNA binding domain-containing protein [Treponema sp.]
MDKEKAKKNLKTILDKMYDDANLSLLHEYNKLYKKEISIFKRSWTAAWLFMYYDQRETPRPQNAERQQKPEKTFTAERNTSNVPYEQITLPEEGSKRLFISIGKNRRLFPKEVITLIMSKTSSAREDIGVIRILDNYSFVQVRDIKADEIITSLNGLRFRGRTLAVNYAKPKSSEVETDS